MKSVEQLPQVGHYDVGAVAPQRFRVPFTVDSDHQTEAASPARLYTGDRILNHHSSFGFDAELSRPLEKRVRCRFAG